MQSPLSIARAARAFVRLVRDPANLDEVFVLADAMESSMAIEQIRAEFATDPAHVRALEERPRLGKLDLDALSALPAGTLGHEFAANMRRLGLDPDDIVVNDVRTDFDFVRAHLRETHDVWHTVTGFGTDVAGELGLQAFYLGQFRAPLSALLLMVGFANTLFFSMDDKDARMREIARGWLLGRRARTFFGVRWADMWAEPLGDVRRRMSVDVDVLDRFLDEFVAGLPLSVARPTARAAA